MPAIKTKPTVHMVFSVWLMFFEVLTSYIAVTINTSQVKTPTINKGSELAQCIILSNAPPSIVTKPIIKLVMSKVPVFIINRLNRELIVQELKCMEHGSHGLDGFSLICVYPLNLCYPCSYSIP